MYNNRPNHKLKRRTQEVSIPSHSLSLLEDQSVKVNKYLIIIYIKSIIKKNST